MFSLVKSYKPDSLILSFSISVQPAMGKALSYTLKEI